MYIWAGLVCVCVYTHKIHFMFAVCKSDDSSLQEVHTAAVFCTAVTESNAALCIHIRSHFPLLWQI